MANQELINYISSNMRRGVSYEDIQLALLSRGYSDYDITEAVNSINGVGINKEASLPTSSKYFQIKSNLKYFFLGFFCLVLLIVIIIIMIPIIKNAQENVVTVQEGSLSPGKSFDLLKNNLIQFERINGSINFTVKAKKDSLIFSGPIEFVLEKGLAKPLDIDGNDLPDYIITYLSSDGDRKIFIQSICFEDWECKNWSACILGSVTRKCSDLNSCSTFDSQPSTIKNCTEEVEKKAALVIPAAKVSETTKLKLKVTVHEILSCGEGIVYNKKDYCSGKVVSVSNSTDILTCCFGQVVDVLDFSDSLRSIWTSMSSSGNCRGNISDPLFECSSYKCLGDGQILYKGVLGMTGVFCSYYEELPNGKEMYCEYSNDDRKNIAEYYSSESLASEVIHNSSGTFLDGKLTRNYAKEAVTSGVCQTL